MTERRAKRPVDDEEEDNTLSLAQMEETLKPQALEKFANITAIYKKFSKMEAARLDAMAAGIELSAASWSSAVHRRGLIEAADVSTQPPEGWERQCTSQNSLHFCALRIAAIACKTKRLHIIPNTTSINHHLLIIT